jgi:hypothetical protein
VLCYRYRGRLLGRWTRTDNVLIDDLSGGNASLFAREAIRSMESHVLYKPPWLTESMSFR